MKSNIKTHSNYCAYFNLDNKKQSFNDRMLETFLCEAERKLNDRLLLPGEDNVEDFYLLIPNKLLLLLGTSGIGDLSEERIPMIKKWKQAKYMKDTFLKKWLKEYVLTLQTRDSWGRLCGRVRYLVVELLI